MSKQFGPMMSGSDSLRLLARIVKSIESEMQYVESHEQLERMTHRFEYLVNQADPITPIYHKGIYGRKYDRWTCGNCGNEISYNVIQNY